MKWIVQFVLKQFAKRSDKKTGVAKLLNETDPIVQSNVRNIEIQLKNPTKKIKNKDQFNFKGRKYYEYRNITRNGKCSKTAKKASY